MPVRYVRTAGQAQGAPDLHTIAKPSALRGRGEGGGDGAKNAAIILVGRGSNGAVAFGNNGRGEKERDGGSCKKGLALDPL